MKKRVRLLSTLILGSALLAGACGDDDGRNAAGADHRLRVVAGFYPLFEAAQRVAGGRAEVTNLTPAGTEPHDLELTSREVDTIEGADLVLYLGAGFQPAIEEVAKRSEGVAIDVIEGLPRLEAAGQEEGSDPHFWLDPALFGRVVEEVQMVLADLDPAGAGAYRANADAYRRQLGLLDDEFGRRLASCERRVIVTAHAAFGYLARRYALTQEPIAGISPESEPDPARLAELTELVRRTGTTTIFSETLMSPKVAETLAREAGVSTAVLNPLEGLTEEEVAAGADYLSIMRDNLDILAEALGCGRPG